MGKAAVTDFRAETSILRPPNGPILRRRNHRSISMLQQAESVVASARPPCLSGPIKIRLKPRLSRKAAKAVQTGVLVSFRAKKAGANTLVRATNERPME